MQTTHSPNPSNNVINNEAQQQERRRRRRRRRRPKNKRNVHKQATDEPSQAFTPSVPQETRLDLKDLAREASALEKQLNELQTQLTINYTNIPKDQGRRANAIAIEQVTATKDEMDYVRKRLKTVYRQILTRDLLYASSQRIEDRLWRYIFYPPIEETRSQLRKLSSDDSPSKRQRLLTSYHQYIDASFKFYRELNHKIKSSYNVDTKTIGIDIFRHDVSSTAATEEEKVAMLLQSNYICMGDLARYRASLNLDKGLPPSSSSASSSKHHSLSADAWYISKTCYQKAVDVYRSSGKPYSQLALISASTGSIIDVVWYYCMSLAMRFPSSLGHDNLKSFYSKVRFTTKTLSSLQSQSIDKALASQWISHFVESFLQMHHAVVFRKSESFPPMSEGMCLVLRQMVATVGLDTTMLKTTSSILNIIRSTLTRLIAVLIISIWYLGERIKDKANIHERPELHHLQMILLDYGFTMLISLCKTNNEALEKVKNTLPSSDESSAALSNLSSLVESAVLPALSIWCSYLYVNIDVIAHYCHGADGRSVMLPNSQSKGITKRALVRSIQTLCSLLISHSSFPLPVQAVLPSSYPLSEDILLLGVVPLVPFHANVDFFKEAAYTVDEQSSADARKQVRWGRVREWIRKMADSTSFAFVQFNQTEQNYSVIDENAKRQQQSRFMKALATQRLMEQVSSLEKNVNKMTLAPNSNGQNPANQVKTEKMDIYTVIVDATAFLDGLTKVKKWANQTLNVRRRIQTSILQVIVPLDVIDVLDRYKKGDTHMNLQARESIRYLDQQLTIADSQRKDMEGSKPPTKSYLRTQKVDEKLTDWNQASLYYIGGRSKTSQDTPSKQARSEPVLTDSDDVVDDEYDDVSVGSDVELFKARGRRRGRQFRQSNHDEDMSDTDTDTDGSATEDDDDEDDEDDEDDDEYTTDEELEDEEVEEEEDEEEEEDNTDNGTEIVEEERDLTIMDIPKSYRSLFSCILYFYQQQRQATPVTPYEEVDHLILVTNDENVAKWAERFGDASTGKSLSVYTVDEWEYILNTKSFGRDHDSSRRNK